MSNQVRGLEGRVLKGATLMGEGLFVVKKKPGSREPTRKSTMMTSTKMPSDI